jgi:peptidase M28-like protein
VRVAALLLLFLPRCLVAQTEFSQENAERVLKHLVLDIGPRPMGSPAEQRALEYAVSSFRESGCGIAYVMPFDRTGRVNTSSGIAVGIKQGATGRIILIGGHIDSAGPEIPGADDDGSGAATVLELARLFGNRPTHSTLVFCCFGGEEQGLEGSKHFASTFSELDSIDLMLQADMANGLGTIDIDPDSYTGSAPPWLVRAAIEEFYRLGNDHLRYPTHFFSLNYALPAGSGSDHESFLARGIPAVDFSTDISKPIHTPRDNFENFDPRGMKRTGDLFARLITRFDGGVPDRTTDRYWLMLLYHTPLIVPLWGVKAFAAISLCLGAVAFVSLRKRREPPGSPHRIRWPGLKMFIAALIIVSCGWLSSDGMAVVRGLRHPWLTAIPLYYLFAFLAAAIGCWVSIHLLRRLRLSHCPYVFFKRAAIALSIFLLLPLFVSVKLTVEPAAALFLISLAALTRREPLKLLLVALSPWWIFRLPFSEWDSILFRSVASGLPARPLPWLLFNGAAILLFSILLLPFLLAVVSIIRDSPQLRPVARLAGSPGSLIASLLLFVALGGYLMTLPGFDRFWYRDLHIDERYDASDGSRELKLRSSEYLDGIVITHGTVDTLLDAGTTMVSLTPAADFDTTWLEVGREEERRQTGDATLHDITLRLGSKRRPLSVSVSYESAGEPLRAFDTPYQFRQDPRKTRIEWYSYPDSTLLIPVRFSTTGTKGVTERIEVTFDRLADPVHAAGEKIYLLPRTTYTSTHRYE